MANHHPRMALVELLSYGPHARSSNKTHGITSRASAKATSHITIQGWISRGTARSDSCGYREMHAQPGKDCPRNLERTGCRRTVIRRRIEVTRLYSPVLSNASDIVRAWLSQSRCWEAGAAATRLS